MNNFRFVKMISWYCLECLFKLSGNELGFIYIYCEGMGHYFLSKYEGMKLSFSYTHITREDYHSFINKVVRLR